MKKTRRFISFLVGLIIIILPAFADEIHDAAKEGNLEKVRALVSEDSTLVNAKTERGTTPLHYACTSKNIEIVKFLITKGADINAMNDSLYSPLHYAAAYNQPEVVKFLLMNEAELEARTREGETPLHMTCYDGALEAAKILIEYGADLHVRNDYGRTALLLVARESGSVEMAKLLLDKGADINVVDKANDNTLELAAWRGFRDLVNFLLDKGAKIPDQSKARQSLLNHSIKRRLERLLQALIKAGLDLKEVRKSYPQLILAAAAGGSTQILDLLVKEGFDLDYVDANGWTPLHNAAEFGRNEAIIYLLSKGAKINARTKMGETAFNVAQSEKNKETAEILKKNGAHTGPPQFPILKGEYLGQKKPGNTPVPFAPGIVKAHYGLHTSISFSPDGKTAFWSIMIPPRDSGYGSGRMLGTTVIDGNWTYPAPPEFIGRDVPFFSPDGKRLYFISRKPVKKGAPRKENIWFVERTKAGWSEPKPVDPVVNSAPMHWQFSIDEKGNFYFGSGDGRILVSQIKGGKYQNPTDFRELYKNDSVKGGSPFISPGGDYLIFSKDDDLHITFRKPDDSWTQAQNLGKNINSLSYDLCPIVSPDGEYLFYLTNREDYWGPHWVAIKDTIKNLRNIALNQQ